MEFNSSCMQLHASVQFWHHWSQDSDSGDESGHFVDYLSILQAKFLKLNIFTDL